MVFLLKIYNPCWTLVIPRFIMSPIRLVQIYNPPVHIHVSISTYVQLNSSYHEIHSTRIRLLYHDFLQLSSCPTINNDNNAGLHGVPPPTV